MTRIADFYAGLTARGIAPMTAGGDHLSRFRCFAASLAAGRSG